MWPGAAQWRLVTDGVMGGVSRGTMEHATVAAREAVAMRGHVSLENNGGFLQLSLDLGEGQAFDAGGFEGVAIDACGNGERYGVHLRSTDTTRPQQSWRAAFVAPANWETIRFPFASFVPHRIDLALDTSRLRRIGIVAIGRAFVADIAIARIAFY